MKKGLVRVQDTDYGEGIELVNTLNYPILIITIICVLFLVFARLYRYEYMPSLFSISKNKNIFETQQISYNHLGGYTLLINYFLTLGLISFFFFDFFHISNVSGYYVYPLVSLTFLLITILKFFALKIFCFAQKITANPIISYHLKYFQVSGVLFLFFFSFIYYSGLVDKFTTLILLITLWLILIFLRNIRLFFISLQSKIPFVYIFLYICTLEILPLILLFKWLRVI